MNPYNLLRLVQRHGLTLVLRKVSDGTYNPATGSLAGGSVTEHEITAYMYDALVGVEGNSEIRRGVKKVAIPALGLTVEPFDSDEITGLGDKVVITNVKTHLSNSIPVLYSCEVRE